MAKLHLLKIRTSTDIFSIVKRKVSFGLKYSTQNLISIKI